VLRSWVFLLLENELGCNPSFFFDRKILIREYSFENAFSTAIIRLIAFFESCQSFYGIFLKYPIILSLFFNRFIGLR